MCLKKKPKSKPGQGIDENGNPVKADNAISDWDRNKSDKIATVEDEAASSPTRSPKVVDDKEDVIDDEMNGDNDDGESEERVTVPLTITMIIITLYILIGALIFNQFEGWTLIQSGYFCYITLATIGKY